MPKPASTSRREAAFAKLATDGTAGYRVLARLREAAELAPTDRAAAVNAYDAIAADGSAGQVIHDLAAVRAGYLLVDSAPYSELLSRLEPLTAADRTFPPQRARDFGALGLEVAAISRPRAMDRHAHDRPADAVGNAQPRRSFERAHRRERQGLRRMLPNRSRSSLISRRLAALALALVLARCTPGGQFDPTTLFNNDMFDTKTKLKGQRVPVFPNGVPGATTGVPADLVKGYQPPPDQADADPDAINAPPPDQTAQQQPAKPEQAKPKVAIGRPRTRVQKPPSSTPTRIDVGAKGAPAQRRPRPTGRQRRRRLRRRSRTLRGRRRRRRQPPPQAAQQSQNIWPAPPPTAPVQPTAAPAQAPASQPGSQSAAPSFDSMWPKSTPNGTQSQ